MQNFNELNIHTEAKEAQQDAQAFMDQYIELLLAMGLDNEVDSLKRLIQFRTSQGAEMAEALSEHYLYTKKHYGY